MDKKTTTKDRILQFVKNQGIKKADFYNEIGVSASNFKGVGLKSELGGEILVKILHTYGDLSAEWLLRGDGEMCKNNNLSIAAEPVVHYKRTCTSCHEKDMLLKEKTERINELKEMIDLLKKTALSKRNSA